MTDLAAGLTDAGGWSVPERRAVLAAVDRTLDGLSVVRSALLVMEKASLSWQGSGDRTFEAWRGRTSRAGTRAAVAQTRVAEQLDTVPGVAGAVLNGTIGLDHASVIAKVAATGTDAQRAAATSEQGQRELMDLAGRVDAGTFATTVDRWAAQVDPGGLERDHQAQRANRYLHVSDTTRGTIVKGLLDSMAGHRLILALEAVSPRPGADDERTAEQRRADALETLANAVLTDPRTTPGAHVRPHVSVIMTEDTWAGAQADRDRRRLSRATFGFGADDTDPTGNCPTPIPAHATQPATATGTRGAVWSTHAWSTQPGAVGAPVGGYAPATLEDGTPVPMTELAVLLCEADLTRIVIDADGTPTDLGRTERLYTDVHRRAVIARDRECAWPECHTHARWCQIHHILWWERDLGPTSIDNGVLLCAFHHHEVHRQDLTLTRHRIEQPDDDAKTRPRRVRGTVARVTYQFHTRTGQRIGAPPGAGRAELERSGRNVGEHGVEQADRRRLLEGVVGVAALG